MFRRPFNRFHNVLVTNTTEKIALQAPADLIPRGMGIAPEQL